MVQALDDVISGPRQGKAKYQDNADDGGLGRLNLC